jgi:hypothetical protein
MSDKHRKELARKAKKKEMERKQRERDKLTTPVREADCEIWSSARWDEDAEMEISVLRRLPSGRYVEAVFLLEDGIAPIVDALLVEESSAEHYHQTVLPHLREKHGQLLPMELETVRQLVADATEHAKSYGMKTPAELGKCVQAIGGVGVTAHGPVKFRGDFWGTVDDLIFGMVPGNSLEKMLFRRDIDYRFDVGEGADFHRPTVWARAITDIVRDDGVVTFDALGDGFELRVPVYAKAVAKVRAMFKPAEWGLTPEQWNDDNILAYSLLRGLFPESTGEQCERLLVELKKWRSS